MRRWKVAALVLVLALILTAAAAGCARSRKVPNVLGMPYDQAVKKLQDDGFKLGDTRDGFSNNATPGIVARQSPVAGIKLERNGAVSLTVVRPLGSVRTPDVVGLTREQAESALATFSLQPEIAEDYSAVVAAGVVIVQAPQAGIAINPGDVVELVLSKGPAPAQATVPAIVGKKQADAEAALKAAGLSPAPYQSYSTTVAKGLVADQNPVAGASMAPGSKVTLVVSLGPPAPTTASVPNVVGRSQAAAETALRDAGFVPNAVINVNATVAKGIVAGQSPGGLEDLARIGCRHPGVTWAGHVGDRPQRRRHDRRAGRCGDQGRRSHTAGRGATGR